MEEKVTHIGIAVHDARQAALNLAKLLGIENIPLTEYRTKALHYRIGLLHLGGLELELIEPLAQAGMAAAPKGLPDMDKVALLKLVKDLLGERVKFVLVNVLQMPLPPKGRPRNILGFSVPAYTTLRLPCPIWRRLSTASENVALNTRKSSRESTVTGCVF